MSDTETNTPTSALTSTPINDLNKLVTDIKFDKLKSYTISLDEYRSEYAKVREIIKNNRLKIKNIVESINKDSSGLNDRERGLVNSLTDKFKALENEFNTEIVLPEEYVDKKIEKDIEKQKKDKDKQKEEEKNRKENMPAELGDLEPRSSWEDYPLNPEQLLQLKPEKLLAKTNDEVYYFNVILDGKSMILRYNKDSGGDEIALYKNFELSDDYNKEDIKRFIIMVERQGKFQDVEMEGSKGIGNIWHGVLNNSNVPGYKRIGALAGPIAIGGVTMITSLRDLDYTTNDYKQDFGNEIDALINPPQPQQSPQQTPQQTQPQPNIYYT